MVFREIRTLPLRGPPEGRGGIFVGKDTISFLLFNRKNAKSPDFLFFHLRGHIRIHDGKRHKKISGKSRGKLQSSALQSAMVRIILLFQENGVLIFHCRGEDLLRILFAVFIVAAWLWPAGMPFRVFLPAAVSLSAPLFRGERLAGRQNNPPQYCCTEAGQQLPAPAREPVSMTAAEAFVLPEPPLSAVPSAVFPARSCGSAAQPHPPCGARAGPAGKTPCSLALTV